MTVNAPLETPLTKRLGIAHPILLAPMDVVADANLTAAVSAAGGLGILGGGYGDEKWLRHELDRLAENRVRFGVGFITWSLARQPRLLDLALERNPAAVMLSFGDASPFVEPIKRAGAAVICQVQNLQMAKDAVAAGADILVAQGGEGGGHGAVRGMSTLVPEVVDAISADVPVVAAGGIADGRGLAAALMLGASGVLMGTRFYATIEAATPTAAKERVRKAQGDDTARGMVFDITRQRQWPAPFTGRCLRNAHLERWQGRELELLQHVEEEAAKYTAAREAGNFDIAAVIAGEAVGLVHDIPSARDLVRQIVEDAARLLRVGPPRVSLHPDAV
ncbi:nitronate monooxygenase [Variovorax sp. J22R133]|uniref:NAD(P)H-dependent flavin oxidoreductase n=1 Tax=Variovorax brevis TaxID=3053503 RepID=UPI002578AA40|nr:nitronate monooxygenase [Variovorax sp. J22R133]MDM0115834.1 nitronate monooxygenase [Variovorax sp. J22R133]